MKNNPWSWRTFKFKNLKLFLKFWINLAVKTKSQPCFVPLNRKIKTLFEFRSYVSVSGRKPWEMTLCFTSLLDFLCDFCLLVWACVQGSKDQGHGVQRMSAWYLLQNMFDLQLVYGHYSPNVLVNIKSSKDALKDCFTFLKKIYNAVMSDFFLIWQSG